MTMRVSIKDEYVNKFEDFINTLPSEVVDIKKSLDDEINQRVGAYKDGNLKTTPFMDGLDKIREGLVSQL